MLASHGHEHSHDHGVRSHQPFPLSWTAGALACGQALSRSIASHSHSHTHPHRGLKEIRQIIQAAGISQSAKDRAIKIFEALGAAEAKVHNTEH